MYVEVNNARFWVEEAGDGPAVVFFHFGLGDWRVFEPELHALADEFRCIAYDRRFTGRTEAPAEPYSQVEDAIALLDVLGVERAALVGLSGGGKLALDVTFAHPERVRALAHIAAPVTGIPWAEELEELYAGADTPEKEMEIDLQVWAPLGADDFFVELLRQTYDNPEQAVAATNPPVALEEVRVPTLVLTARHDPQSLQNAGREAARRIPQARLVEVDSDHYLTLREPELVTTLLREFLSGHAERFDAGRKGDDIRSST
jgi:3-oxoadipate enol-lactonase